MASRRLMVLILLLTIGTYATAATYTNSPEYSSGTGTDYSATIVVDFDLGNYFSFTYNWDTGETPTGWDALVAIDSASSDFTMAYTDWGWGIMVDDFDYVGGSEYSYEVGDDVGWAYYEGDNVDWSGNMTGVSGRLLSDGDWDSWVWTNYAPNWGPPYRTPGGLPVPEPACIALLGIGGMILRMRKI